ncbi:MAG: hypothetical protein JOY56_16230, partial [Solirubrobacterales bacterium]|nr:hypothetical protein [Solirubrobacterales bacterium]
IDKGNRTVRVRLHVPASGPASVERLLAPSPYSGAGAVTLNGQQLSYTGKWIGAKRTETITPGAHGGYSLTVPARSAAMFSVRLGTARRTIARRRLVSEHHRGVSVAKHPVLAVGLDRPRKH